MIDEPLHSEPVGTLIERLIDAQASQQKALAGDDQKTIDACADQVDALLEELERRPAEQLRPCVSRLREAMDMHRKLRLTVSARKQDLSERNDKLNASRKVFRAYGENTF
ncbi:MAG: hypothetical protein ACLFVU_13965 [Phycisphaerae bacterium]